MKIRILQSGGIAGHEHVELAAIDTSNMPTAEAGRIEELADRVRELSADSREPFGDADVMQYDVEITAADEPPVGLIVFDDQEPENPLLATLNALLAETASS